MASETARKKYPAQIVVMTTDANKARFVREAERDGVSIAEVIRGYLNKGLALGEAEEIAEARTDADLDREAQYRGLV